MKKRILLLVFLSYALSPLMANMVNNGGFEADFTAWRGYAVGGCTTEFTIVNDAYEGDKAASMNVTYIDYPAQPGHDTALDKRTDMIVIGSETDLNISFAAKKVDSDPASRLRVVTIQFDSNTAPLMSTRTQVDYVVTSDEYQLFSFDLDSLHDDAVSLNIQFTVADNAGQKYEGQYYIDAVNVVPEPMTAILFAVGGLFLKRK
ncbi:hypothetical protein SMSP2_02444 [Limihaloglobus sulfuriphilus]|uniref:PEP-CTERM protein-sorting domain-containing protein n=1 Tax=Limihaloglobus sulfuriphilus TaxID=1851148 RepID=A0A1Q2MHC9_9BACT|nr:hypothetical protein [Limihaloglobus sulfuriphilus]AQQ72064.1 hypothetical protein SMSP2_02444 [Limihaloglobus sulfuriphilus]